MTPCIGDETILAMQDIVDKHILAWKSQLKKGSLELAVLALLKSRRHYGLELFEVLNKLDIDVSEGSIYPLLSRLKNEQKVITEWVDEGSGHSHKYYELTEYGQTILLGMSQAWLEYTGPMSRLVEASHE